MKKSLFIAGLLACGTLYGQNPIVPPGVYLADPEGHQWKDGKLYLYVSRDESPDYYCSWSYDLLSTIDITVCGTRSTQAWQYRTRPTDRSKTVSR